MTYAKTMISEKRVLQWDNKRVVYTLEIKKVKNLTMRINDKGELIIVSNPYIPLEKIETFVKEKVEWILKKQEKQSLKYNRIYEDANVQNYFYLYDTRLNIVRIQSNQNKVRYDEKNLYIYYIKEDDIHKTIVKFIRKTCEEDFMVAVKHYYALMKDYGFAFPEVKYRDMKSRWGSCTPRKKQICLNTRMLHYPKAFMEYVVLHELAHFVEPNHSASFYNVIAYYMHDYKERMKLIGG